MFVSCRSRIAMIVCRGSLLLAIAITCLVSGATASETSPAAASASEYCGPKAVRMILKHYDQDEDLYDLIGEMQPDHHVACSLQSVIDAIESRGIKCIPANVSSSRWVRWDGPFVVHTTSYPGGHFGVVLPSRDSPPGFIDVHVSPNEVLRFTEAEFAGWRSNAVVLTSTNQQASAGDAFPFSLSLATRQVSFVFWLALLFVPAVPLLRKVLKCRLAS